MKIGARIASLLCAVAVTSCAAQPPSPAEHSNPGPPPPPMLRCKRGDGPLPAPLEWPKSHSIEMSPDRAARDRADRHWHRARELAKEHRFVEACKEFRAEWRESLALGYRANLIPIFFVDRCPDEWSEYLSYQVGESCPISASEYPDKSALERTGGYWWRARYLSGLNWFRLGDYDRAIECVGQVPREHDWFEAAYECWQLAKEYKSMQPPAPPPVVDLDR
jgi:hypothetical protein